MSGHQLTPEEELEQKAELANGSGESRKKFSIRQKFRALFKRKSKQIIQPIQSGPLQQPETETRVPPVVTRLMLEPFRDTDRARIFSRGVLCSSNSLSWRRRGQKSTLDCNITLRRHYHTVHTSFATSSPEVSSGHFNPHSEPTRGSPPAIVPEPLRSSRERLEPRGIKAAPISTQDSRPAQRLRLSSSILGDRLPSSGDLFSLELKRRDSDVDEEALSSVLPNEMFAQPESNNSHDATRVVQDDGNARPVDAKIVSEVSGDYKNIVDDILLGSRDLPARLHIKSNATSLQQRKQDGVEQSAQLPDNRRNCKECRSSSPLVISNLATSHIGPKFVMKRERKSIKQTDCELESLKQRKSGDVHETPHGEDAAKLDIMRPHTSYDSSTRSLKPINKSQNQLDSPSLISIDDIARHEHKPALRIISFMESLPLTPKNRHGTYQSSVETAEHASETGTDELPSWYTPNRRNGFELEEKHRASLGSIATVEAWVKGDE